MCIRDRLEIEFLEVIEIGMDLEVAAVLDPMQSAAEVGGVRKQIRNSGEILEVGEKRAGIQRLGQSSRIGPDDIGEKCELVVVGFSIEKLGVSFRAIDDIDFGQHLVQGLRICLLYTSTRSTYRSELCTDAWFVCE